MSPKGKSRRRLKPRANTKFRNRKTNYHVVQVCFHLFFGFDILDEVGEVVKTQIPVSLYPHRSLYSVQVAIECKARNEPLRILSQFKQLGVFLTRSDRFMIVNYRNTTDTVLLIASTPE